MSSRGTQPARFMGPWNGVNENQLEAKPNQLEDGWNVSFDEGLLSNRKGRKLVTRNWACIPSSFLAANYNAPVREFSVAPGGDHTAQVVDNDSTTVALMGGAGGGTALTSGDALYFGMPFPFFSLTLTFTAVEAAARTITWEIWNGYEWAAPTLGGSANAAGLAASGTITVGSTNEQVPLKLFGRTQYWWRARYADATAAATFTLNEVRVDLVVTGSPQLGPFYNGLGVYTKRDGTKYIMIGADNPGYVLGMPATVRTNNSNPQHVGHARLLYLDENTGIMHAVNLPQAAMGTGPGARWVFVTHNDYLIATNGYGPPIQFDGRQCSVLKATWGTDRNSAAYLGAPPWGKHFAVMDSGLYIGGGIDSPRTVYFSNPEGDSDPGINAAPVGGPNLWRAGQDFDVDDDITGMVSTGHVLHIFTKDSIWLWTGLSLSRVVSGTGCLAPASLASLQDGSIMFLASEGVFRYDGHTAFRVSHQVHWTMTKYAAKPHLWRAHAARYRKNNHYRLWLEGWCGEEVCLIYDYARDTWTKWGIPLPADTTLMGNSTSRYCANAAIGFETVGAGEQLYTVGDAHPATPPTTAGQREVGLWIEDAAPFDQVGVGLGVVSTENYPRTTLVLSRAGVSDAARQLFRYLRVLANTTAVQFRVYPLYDNANWRSIISNAGTSLLSLTETGDPVVDTAAITTGNWREARVRWHRHSIAARRRYSQIALVSEPQSGVLQPFTIYGYELDVRPEAGKL